MMLYMSARSRTKAMVAEQPSQAGDESPGVIAGSPALAGYLTFAAVLAFATALVWGLSGAGYFWPRWAWLGLGIPAAFWILIRRARRIRDGGDQRFVVVAGGAAVLSAMMILIWWFGHPGQFWPAWPIAVFATVVGTYAVIRHRSLPWLRERQLTERVEELTRTRRGALDVQAEELRRIERDLHDGAQARLVALSMKLGRAEERLDDNPEVAELVRQARLDAAGAIAELRDLARGIAPPVLADRGLAAAVDALGRRSPIPVVVDAHIDRRPAPVVETAAYFVAAESLTNVAKHAGGASARVSLWQNHGDLMVEVTDDGPGGADPNGSGLIGLRRRVEALDGTLTVTSPSGRGTTIRAHLPCES
jgi:signal transduction histidine kinase